MTLAPEQLELLIYLSIALVIGFLFGYLLKRAFSNEKYKPIVKKLTKESDNKSQKIELASTRYDQLKQHMAVQSRDLESSKQQMIDMQGIVGKFEKSAAALRSNKSELEEILEKKNTQLDQHNTDMHKLNEEIGFVKDELIDAQSKADEFKNVNSDQKAKILTAQTELKKNIKLNQQLIKDIEQNKHNEKQLADEKEAAMHKLDIAHQDNQQLQQRVEGISKTLEENKAIISRLDEKSVDTDVLTQKNSELQKAADVTQKELEQKNNNIAKLEKELNQQKELFKTDKKDNTKIIALQKELEQLQNDMNKKDKVLKETQRAYNQNKNFQAQESTEITNSNSKNGWGFGDLAIVKLAKDAISDFKEKHHDEDDVKKNISVDSEKLSLYKDDVLKYHGSVDVNLLKLIMLDLEPLNSDLVDCGKKSELDIVREDFLKKRLELEKGDEALDTSIAQTCEKMKDAKNKYRVTFYYILVKYHNKESKIN